jgi:hypothetical protein
MLTLLDSLVLLFGDGPVFFERELDPDTAFDAAAGASPTLWSAFFGEFLRPVRTPGTVAPRSEARSADPCVLGVP